MKVPHNYEADDAGCWGGAARFMLMWALAFYADGETRAADRHFAVAYQNVREAARRANVELDTQQPHPDRVYRERVDRDAMQRYPHCGWIIVKRGPFYCESYTRG